MFGKNCMMKIFLQVWGIVSEFYIMKEESLGGDVTERSETIQRPGYKRRFQPEKREREEPLEDGDEFGEKRRRGADGDGDTWSKAERYSKAELDKVQQIPKKKPKTEKTEEDEPMFQPTSEEIQKMLAKTKQSIEDKKKALNIVTPPTILSHKEQQLAALRASIASKIQSLPKGPVPLIINDSGRTVDSSGNEIQLNAHIPTLKANLKNVMKKEEFKPVKPEPEIEKKKEEEGPTFIDPRVSQRGAVRSRRVMQFHDAGKFQDEARRIRMKETLEKLQSEISSKSRKTGISSATQLAKLLPKGGASDKVPDIEWWDQLLIGSHDYENWEVRPGAISNLIEHPIQLKPMESTRTVHVPMFLTKKERKKLRRQNRREALREKMDKVRLGLVAPDEPKVKLSNLMRVLGNEAVMDPTKVEAHVRAQVAK